MRILLTYFLSFLIIFAPTYSAYASGITKGQIISIGKAGGAMIKTAGGIARKYGTPVGATITGVGTAWSWCKNNQKKCKDIIGDVADIVCDDNECTANRKDDGGDDGQCLIRYDFDKGQKRHLTLSDFVSELNSKTKIVTDYTIFYLSNDYTVSDLERAGQSRLSYAKNSSGWVYYDDVFRHDYKTVVTDTQKQFGGITRSQSYLQVAIKCNDTDDDKRLSDDELSELAKKIAEKMDNNDITNYYNTEYGDIIINNRKYDGDEINQQTNIDNKCQNNSCNELSKEVENAVRKGKIDIDDVNEKNCKLEKNTGKYIACNIDIDKDSDDSDTTNNTDKDDDDTTNNTKKDEEDNEHWCDTTDLTREACEYFDWVDDEPDTKEDKKVEIEDEEEEPLDKDQIDIDGACPHDEHISISMPWGYSTTITFTYEPYCDFARKLKPYMTTSGAIVAMYIVGSCGRRI